MSRFGRSGVATLRTGPPAGGPARRRCALVALCLAAGSPLAAGVGQRDLAAAFQESLEAVEVQVPVTVVDKSGDPVRSLQQEDFELLDNGRRQELVGFQMIDLETLEPTFGRLDLERAVPPAARRYFLLLFDLSFSRQGSVSKARLAARRFVVEQLHPTDLAAVAVLTAESGPQLVVTFTPDRAQIARALDTLEHPSLVHLTESGDPLRFLVETPAGAGRAFAAGRAPVPDDNFRSSNREVEGYFDVISQRMSSVERSFDRGRVDGWSQSMAQLARALDNLRGRKYVVYLSEGFGSHLLHGAPLSSMGTVAGQELTALERNQLGVLDSEELFGSGQLQSSLDRMLQEFRRADCVIQAIDISGLEGTEGSVGAGSQSTLFYLANETGGELYGDANDFDQQLQTLLRRTAVTYLLTFQPRRIKLDGSYHRLKVRAALPSGARLVHRVGYYAPRPFEQLHRFERELLIAEAIAGAAPTTAIGVEVLAPPFRAGSDRVYVPVVLEIAGGTLLVGHVPPHLPVEVYAYVTDDQGRMRDFFTHVLTVDLQGRREIFGATGLKYYGHVDLAAGAEYLLRVVVRNGTTGRTGVATVPLDVPAYSDRRPVVLPPFFVEPTPKWFMVREQPPEELGESWIVYPFTIKGQPFVPAVRPTLRAHETAQLCLVVYNLGVEEVRLAGRVTTEGGDQASGGRLELEERIVASTDGVDKLLVRFSPAGLAPGRYSLQLELQDPSWREPTRQQVDFEVVE